MLLIGLEILSQIFTSLQVSRTTINRRESKVVPMETFDRQIQIVISEEYQFISNKSLILIHLPDILRNSLRNQYQYPPGKCNIGPFHIILIFYLFKSIITLYFELLVFCIHLYSINICLSLHYYLIIILILQFYVSFLCIIISLISAFGQWVLQVAVKESKQR